MELEHYDPWLVVGKENAAHLPRRTREEPGPAWRPVMDAFHTERDMVLRYEIPGVRPEDLDIRVDGRVLFVRGVRVQPDDAAPPELTMRAEREFGDFDRSIALPDGTDPAGVRASYLHGVLEIRIAHVTRPTPRDVPVVVPEATATPIEVSEEP